MNLIFKIGDSFTDARDNAEYIYTILEVRDSQYYIKSERYGPYLISEKLLLEYYTPSVNAKLAYLLSL